MPRTMLNCLYWRFWVLPPYPTWKTPPPGQDNTEGDIAEGDIKEVQDYGCSGICVCLRCLLSVCEGASSVLVCRNSIPESWIPESWSRNRGCNPSARQSLPKPRSTIRVFCVRVGFRHWMVEDSKAMAPVDLRQTAYAVSFSHLTLPTIYSV